jgi:hypothetical protein
LMCRQNKLECFFQASSTFASEEGAFPSEAPCSILDNDIRTSLFLPVHQSFIQTATSFAADIDKTQEILMQIFYLQMLVNKKTKFSKSWSVFQKLARLAAIACSPINSELWISAQVWTYGLV